MKYLIYGAGTIGITWAWLLSQNHEVDLLVRPGRYEELSEGIPMAVKDLRKHDSNSEKILYRPNCVTGIEGSYDGIFVAVNRCQLADVLPELSERVEHTGYFAFIQNNWKLQEEIEKYIPRDRYIVSFPSNVGGGRDEAGLFVIVFDEAVRLGGKCRNGIGDMEKALAGAGVKTIFDENIFDWLKVHYLQQSVTAGAVLECGGYDTFAGDYQAVKKVVKAFREGLLLCRMQGVDTNKIFPAKLFKLPLFAVAHAMQNMFLETNTGEMVVNHMKKGMPEWIAGYKEILYEGERCGLPMNVWKSYDQAVERFLSSKTLK